MFTFTSNLVCHAYYLHFSPFNGFFSLGTSSTIYLRLSLQISVLTECARPAHGMLVIPKTPAPIKISSRDIIMYTSFYYLLSYIKYTTHATSPSDKHQLSSRVVSEPTVKKLQFTHPSHPKHPPREKENGLYKIHGKFCYQY